jgi:hypothetical protein
MCWHAYPSAGPKPQMHQHAHAPHPAQVDVGQHKLGALAGLEISATNFPAKERMFLQQLVEQAGGTYSAELHKGRTTHLMCKNGAGKKYRCGRSFTMRWVGTPQTPTASLQAKPATATSVLQLAPSCCHCRCQSLSLTVSPWHHGVQHSVSTVNLTFVAVGLLAAAAEMLQGK